MLALNLSVCNKLANPDPDPHLPQNNVGSVWNCVKALASAFITAFTAIADACSAAVDFFAIADYGKSAPPPFAHGITVTLGNRKVTLRI